MATPKGCTQISALCPVEATTYGYYPNLAGNVILCVVFGATMLAQVGLSVKGRTWTWLIGLFAGCGFEFAGYVGRILMHYNPWNKNAFRLQIITLILGPSFMSAGIDLTLKHLVIRYGERHSLIKPTLYTWVFISIDVFSILVQAAGGAMAASGESNYALLRNGNNVILAGIALQVAQLIAFGLVSAHFAWTVKKNGGTDRPPVNARLKFFLFCITLAFTTILIRCVYRLPEMAGGWGGRLQREEASFMVLDGAMVAIAALSMTIAHPTIFFPDLGKGLTRLNHSAVEEKAPSGELSS